MISAFGVVHKAELPLGPVDDIVAAGAAGNSSKKKSKGPVVAGKLKALPGSALGALNTIAPPTSS